MQRLPPRFSIPAKRPEAAISTPLFERVRSGPAGCVDHIADQSWLLIFWCLPSTQANHNLYAYQQAYCRPSWPGGRRWACWRALLFCRSWPCRQPDRPPMATPPESLARPPHQRVLLVEFLTEGFAWSCRADQKVPRAGYTPYQGSGYSLLIPSKWAPNKERTSRDVVFRLVTFEANHKHLQLLASKATIHATCPTGMRTTDLPLTTWRSLAPRQALLVLKLGCDALSWKFCGNLQAGKSSITDFGSPSEFLTTINQLFGKNVWQGAGSFILSNSGWRVLSC